MTVEPAPITPASPLPPAGSTARSRRSSRLLDLALAGAAVIAIGGVAFAIGRATAPQDAAVGFAPGGAIVRPGTSFDPAAGSGPRFALDGDLTIDGTVTAVDADSITVRTSDGQEMTFDLGDSTSYRHATDASASDVTVGDDVSVKVANDGPMSGPVGSGETPRLAASDVTVTR